ncbi:MAG: DUF1846 domain-containing protein [Oscillospiraceae bacterium]|nr:DUF1846 domain-containing protein [Oscillospiraceae bacterium]
MNRQAFDNVAYLQTQSEHIRQRIARFGGKLYLEFGGKLFDDYHAARVLPGFAPDSKVRMLLELREQVEIVIVINAADIEKNKVRGDLGITYDLDVLRLIDAFRDFDLLVSGVVITQYGQNAAAEKFRSRLERLGIQVYCHYPIAGYPADIARVVSDEGYGKNDYIETTRPLVVLTAPGPGSGKLSACMSQLYHDSLSGMRSGYAKFETFPVWDLPLGHPVNMAYEAATADLDDVNMIDPFHLEAYGTRAVSYNRDIEVFPLLSAIFQRIWGQCPYKSPTDMGVNMVGKCISDDEAVSQAAKQEIIRRYYAAMCAHHQGLGAREPIFKIELLMSKAGITTADRPVVGAAVQKAETSGVPAAAIELPDGTIITGKTSPLLGAPSSMLLNALKHLAGLDDAVLLIAPTVIEPVQALKSENLGNANTRLHTEETLIALSICAVTDPNARRALDQLPKLSGCEVHSTVILSQTDEGVFRKLGVNLTSEPQYQTHKLYHR